MQPEATTQPQGTKDQPHGTTFGQGGLLGAAESAASSGANMMAPGSGAIMQIAMQEANLAVSKIGDIAAIMAVEAPLETFTLHGPEGQSGDLSNTLPFKLLGAAAQSHPNIPNEAGTHGPAGTQPPENQRKGEGSTQMQQSAAGDQIGVNVDNMHFYGGGNPNEVTQGLKRAVMSNPGATPMFTHPQP
jgi:hypothetical protein